MLAPKRQSKFCGPAGGLAPGNKEVIYMTRRALLAQRVIQLQQKSAGQINKIIYKNGAEK